MKNFIFPIIAFSSVISSAVATTTVSVTNFVAGNTTDRAITNNAGSTFLPVGGGSIQIGYFSSFSTSLDFSGANRSQLLSDFNQFSSTTRSFANGFSAAGFFDVSFDDTVADNASPFFDQNLFVMIGNQATLAASDEFLVYRTSRKFAAEDATPPPHALSGTVQPAVGDANGVLLLGTDGGNLAHPLGGDVGTYRMAVVVVPEPSSTALLGLAGVALLLRRRR